MVERDKLLKEIHRLADGDSPPIKKQNEDAGEYSEYHYRKEFGGWNEALQEAGYIPNKEKNIDDDALLLDLAKNAQGRVALPPDEYNGRYSSRSIELRFESWWRGCVRAGLHPHNRRPLTSSEFRKLFEAAISQQNAQYQLIALLFQFTGLSDGLIEEMSEDWITERVGDTLVTVPEEKTRSGERWTFQIPSTWNDGDKRRDTTLDDLLNWYFNQGWSFPDNQTIRRILFQVAADADLNGREKINWNHTRHFDTVPLVRPSDLRATGGIRMARSGAPARRIRRHLGLEHMEWSARVRDFFIWCDVYNANFSHPDYNRPDYLLDS